MRLISRRGFAFVELSSEDADAAVEALKGVELKGRTMDVTLERSSGGRPSGWGGRGGFRRRR